MTRSHTSVGSLGVGILEAIAGLCRVEAQIDARSMTCTTTKMQNPSRALEGDVFCSVFAKQNLVPTYLPFLACDQFRSFTSTSQQEHSWSCSGSRWSKFLFRVTISHLIRIFHLSRGARLSRGPIPSSQPGVDRYCCCRLLTVVTLTTLAFILMIAAIHIH